MFKMFILVVSVSDPSQSLSGNLRMEFKTLAECEAKFDVVRADMEAAYGKMPGGIQVIMKCKPVVNDIPS